MGGDEPALTRWSFEDLKMFYNARFGRKKESKEERTEARSDHETSYPSGVVHANADSKNMPELAVFEQFERQGRSAVISNGALGRPYEFINRSINFPSLCTDI